MKKIILGLLALIMALGFMAVPAAAEGPDDWGRPKLEENWGRQYQVAPGFVDYLQCRNTYTNDPTYGPLARCTATYVSGGYKYGKVGWYSLANGTFSGEGSYEDISAGSSWPNGIPSATCDWGGVSHAMEFYGTGRRDTGYGPLDQGYIYRKWNGTTQAVAVQFVVATNDCAALVGQNWRNAYEIVL